MITAPNVYNVLMLSWPSHPKCTMCKKAAMTIAHTQSVQCVNVVMTIATKVYNAYYAVMTTAPKVYNALMLL